MLQEGKIVALTLTLSVVVILEDRPLPNPLSTSHSLPRNLTASFAWFAGEKKKFLSLYLVTGNQRLN